MAENVDEWINNYVRECRGPVTREQVQADVELAFPLLTLVQIAMIVARIWKLIRKRRRR